MEKPEESRVEVEYVRGQSRVVSSLSIPPLKILNPENLSDAAMVYLSSYGGGMVQGDTVRLGVRCGEQAKVFIGSQANNRVFKHIDQGDAHQDIHGTIEAGGLVVNVPDPLVMHAEARFHQIQNWMLSGDASLVLADWIQSGRSDSGESFAYQQWESDLRIHIDGQAACIDRFKSDPSEAPPGSPSRFGDRALMLNLYLAGPIRDELTDHLAPFAALEEVGQIRELSDQPTTPVPGLIVSINPMENAPVTIVRGLGVTREQFDPLFKVLFAGLKPSLGFDPQLRKY